MNNGINHLSTGDSDFAGPSTVAIRIFLVHRSGNLYLAVAPSDQDARCPAFRALRLGTTMLPIGKDRGQGLSGISFICVSHHANAMCLNIQGREMHL